MNVEKLREIRLKINMSSGERVFQVFGGVCMIHGPAYVAAGSCGSATACITSTSTCIRRALSVAGLLYYFTLQATLQQGPQSKVIKIFSTSIIISTEAPHSIIIKLPYIVPASGT